VPDVVASPPTPFIWSTPLYVPTAFPLPIATVPLSIESEAVAFVPALVL